MDNKTLFNRFFKVSGLYRFSKILKCLNPKAYEIIRWKMGKPMNQRSLLPFIIRKGDTVFDIGANKGQFALPLAHLVGKNGIVHAFEPISKSFNELCMSIKREKLSSRIVPNQLALGDSPGYVKFTIPQEMLTEATLIPHNIEGWVNYDNEPQKYFTETCKITTLNQYVKENQIGNINFIKCDVEGAELLVLKGAKSVLQSSSPPILMMEVFEGWSRDFGYLPKDLFEFLKKEAGYEFYWIYESGLKRVEPDDKIIPGIFWKYLDYLCIVPNIHNKRINVKRYLT